MERETVSNSLQLCETCGAPLPPHTPGKLCLRCAGAIRAKSELNNDLRGTVVVTASQVVTEPLAESASGLLKPTGQFGRYRIIRPLGKGGMGAVYEAEETESGRRVALKVLNQSLDSPQDRKRFLREGRLAAAINHPNSVYVFGTEEVNGIPGIVMELVNGGTLQQLVKTKGPLPITEAVDAILQVIQGLEAAAAFGVLHRDVKPSNCFIDDTGMVKIGDFGLSISTATRTETNLTLTGAFLGTPAYSSPEQLQGETLDIRSDIYAVGATLFYLLTGQPPFAGDNMVQLLAHVLERTPESPAKLRSGIPRGLINVVLRCLAKPKDRRFTSYEELRQVLGPFSSAASMPAPLGPRFLAGCLDLIVILFAFVLVGIILNAWIPRLRGYWESGELLLITLYFAGTEGLGGASLGKRTLRLRLTGLGGNSVGFMNVLLRALLFPTLVLAIGGTCDWIAGFDANPWWKRLVLIISTGAVFSTLRRQNGFAGLHDLATRTRVVMIPAELSVRVTSGPPLPARVGLEAVKEPLLEQSGLGHIGPYQILSTARQTDQYNLLLGYDARLLRQVWIVRWRKPEPPLSAACCNLTRPARLRWLSGRRSSDECWDAYAAVAGQPLLELLTQPQPWSLVRRWLTDLAEEFAAAITDRTLPAVLGLDRIWIAPNGQAKLLDFPAPGLSPSTWKEASSLLVSPDSQTTATTAKFLRQLAFAALHGHPLSREDSGSQPMRVPLPLPARYFLDRLPSALNGQTLVDNLKVLGQKPSTVTSIRRRLGLWLSFCFLVLSLGLTAFVECPALIRIIQNTPDLELLRHGLAQVAALQNRSAALDDAALRQKRAWEIYLAVHYREILNSGLAWSAHNRQSLLATEWREPAKNMLDQHPNPTTNEVLAAVLDLKPYFERHPPRQSTNPPWLAVLRGYTFMFSERWFHYFILPILLLCVLLRSGPVLTLTGIAVVAKDGRPASRLQALLRGLLVWSPVLIMPLALLFIDELRYLFIMLLLTMIGSVWTLIHPQRGLPDRVLGTWLVPR